MAAAPAAPPRAVTASATSKGHKQPVARLGEAAEGRRAALEGLERVLVELLAADGAGGGRARRGAPASVRVAPERAGRCVAAQREGGVDAAADQQTARVGARGGGAGHGRAAPEQALAGEAQRLGGQRPRSGGAPGLVVTGGYGRPPMRLLGYLTALMPLANAIAVFAITAYGLFFVATFALPETRGRRLDLI